MDALNKKIYFADNVEHKTFVEQIINGMYDWVRVIDINDNIIFANDSMSKALGKNLIGEKCYEAIGKSEPCENCTSRKAVFEGTIQSKEEIIGDKIFSVMSSPIRDENGKITSVVEVLRDITEMKKMQKKILEHNKKLQSELNMARRLQCSLLPKELPRDKIDFSYVYRPCEAIGGDFLDIFKIDKDHIGIYIADVSGHGVPASMLTVFLRSSINKRTLSPAEALNQLYKEFNRDYYDQELYITVFYAIIDTKNKSITYSNAGHNASPILFNHESQRFDILRIPGVPISDWIDNPGYTEKSISIAKGDRLFMYTDGIVELRNNKSEQFGEERLLNILLGEKLSPAITLDRIIDAAMEFANIKNFNKIIDDITMALLEVI
ncbi:SpoIIE family protein phosphatase [Acetivibrio straminisolvens]|uniref:Serine phosphatase RsbU n=1 Tax=Acetivibrio straminisolvens JCM 21531 TaxID=1294263 RepID=W4V959_9FIRM|nr:SpoIIE family protein phosphatase [Acetivibrio straminisolvens]GAE89747.1 serine phosphatase RsbU [Acetivibrio straminisolvens JCM 21531]